MDYEVIYDNVSMSYNGKLQTSKDFYDSLSRYFFNRLTVRVRLMDEKLSKIIYNDLGLELDRGNNVNVMYDHNGEIKGVEKGEYHLIVNDKYYFIFNRDLQKYRENIIDKIL